jgi:hypothetical protein
MLKGQGYNSVEFFTGVRDAEESPLLVAVARKRPVKTQQAGKGLAGAVVISDGAIIACCSKSRVEVVNKSSHQSKPRLQSHIRDNTLPFR